MRSRVRVAHTLNALDPRPKTRHFIHIPKNGGTAVRLALPLKGIAFERPIHARYVDLPAMTGRRYFCVVRNPWSRTASRYLYTRRSAVNWPDTDERKRYIERVSFEEYVADRRIFASPKRPGEAWPLSLWIDQLDWITNGDGELAGDCLRLESLDEDLSAYLGRQISVPRAGLLKPDSYDYRSMYGHRTRRMVAEAYARDIAHFGFDFHGAATRNTYTLN
jgi:hypothetical protein